MKQLSILEWDYKSEDEGVYIGISSKADTQYPILTTSFTRYKDENHVENQICLGRII